LFGDKKDFLYFAPGTVRIAELSSVPVKNRFHVITMSIHLKGGEEGVIVAVGGIISGFTMLIRDGKL